MLYTRSLPREKLCQILFVIWLPYLQMRGLLITWYPEAQWLFCINFHYALVALLCYKMVGLPDTEHVQ